MHVAGTKSWDPYKVLLVVFLAPLPLKILFNLNCPKYTDLKTILGLGMTMDQFQRDLHLNPNPGPWTQNPLWFPYAGL